MDGPLVHRLDCQVYSRVAKPGRDKRWRHLSVKPPSRWDIPPSGVRPLEDYKVDRAEVEVWQHMELTVTNRSRAWPKDSESVWSFECILEKVNRISYDSNSWKTILHIGDWSNGMIGVSKTFGGSSILSSPAHRVLSFQDSIFDSLCLYCIWYDKHSELKLWGEEVKAGNDSNT